MIDGEKTYTAGGNMRAASLETVSRWVKDCWDDLSQEMIIYSFKKCGISNALDGTEDDALWLGEEPDIQQVEERDGGDLYDDEITSEEMNDLFGESDDDEEFHGFSDI